MEDAATYLGQKGYTIKKENMEIKEQIELRNDLMVKPYVPKTSMAKPESFPIYRESKNKIYIPRFYGLETYGEPECNKLSRGKDIDIKFNGELRDFQKPIVDAYLNHAKKKGSGLLEIHTGAGKTVMGLWCLAALKKKTLIIVHKEFLLRQWIERIEQFLPNARVGRIQASVIDVEDKDIVIGMLQSLSMKEYEQSLFNQFGFTIVDECFPYNQHIHTENGLIRIGSLYEKWLNKEELPKILSFNKKTKRFEYKKMTYAWRKEREDLIKINLSKRVIKCTPEHKILTTKGYVEANKLNEGDLIISKYDKNHIDNIISPALNEDQLQVIYGSYLGDGHISITKMNRYRLRIIHCEKQKEYCEWKAKMFGIKEMNIIENNGYSQKRAYQFNTKIFDLEDEIPKDTKKVPNWLLDKIDERGIAVWYMDDGSINRVKLKDGSISNYISIHSNNFDYDIQEKFVKKFSDYGIICSIHKTKEKYYYLRFNKEYTIKLLELISPYIPESMNYKINLREENYEWNREFLGYGFLKVTGKSYLKNKGANRCKKPYVYDIEVEYNHNFVLGSKGPEHQDIYIDGPVVSNCHHISAEVFSRVLFKVVTPYALGLSATMKRKDGLTKVLKMFLGEVVYKKERKGEDNVVVKAINYYLDDEDFLEISLNYRQQVNYTAMMKKLCELNHRREFILKVIEDLVENGAEDTQIMILGHYKTILTYIYEAIKHRGISTVGYYIGGMKEIELKKSEGKKIIIATYAMAEEGLDIKTLTTLVMATPKSDVTQAVGRILRKKRDESLVIDIVDPHIIFQKQYMKRKRFYKKQNFQLKETDMNGYYKDEWEVKLTNKKSKGACTKKKSKNTPFMNGVCLIKDDD